MPRRMTPATPSPMIVGDPQAYSTPPQEVSKSSALTPDTISAAPR